MAALLILATRSGRSIQSGFIESDLSNMKRLSLFLFGWLLLATPVAVQAQFNYTVTNGTVTITAYTGTNGVVVIPSTIDGLPVTSIGIGAFQYGPIITVSIPNSVTNIGQSAFLQCENLTSVTISSSVTSIGGTAFSVCSSLTNVTIPNSVTSIGDHAFSGCRSLTNITIPNSVTRIGDGAFWDCTSLTNFTIPNSLTSIGGGAFDFCTNLTAINVETNNPAYSSVDGVLFNQSLTTLIQYPCGKVGSYSIPNSVTNIGDSAFSECSSLTSVTIPNSVTSIGNWASIYCSSLIAIMVDSANQNYSSIEGVLFDKGQTTLIQYPSAKAGASYH
jgi:hypothetical protein